MLACRDARRCLRFQNMYFVGRQNRDEQRSAVEAMIAAHDSDVEWLKWYHPERALATAHHVEQHPDPAQWTVVCAWRGSIAHCTHGVLLTNVGGNGARETTFQFMQEYVSTRGSQLTVEYLDDEMTACLRVLPDGRHAANFGHVAQPRRGVCHERVLRCKLA